jgi:hypothetical protein
VLPPRPGLAFSTWSLTKLADYLAAARIAVISRESIRQILHDAGVRWLATKTWKASTDPNFIEKMHRVLDLYDHPPADGRVICVDEFGPLNLQPRPGRAWRPAAHPARLRATYRRTGGVRHMLAALDLATGQMTYRIRDRKRWREFLALLKLLRARWPGQKLYVICDNFSPHEHPKVTGWAAENTVELVFLPTYSSWLNWIPVNRPWPRRHARGWLRSHAGVLTAARLGPDACGGVGYAGACCAGQRWSPCRGVRGGRCAGQSVPCASGVAGVLSGYGAGLCL